MGTFVFVSEGLTRDKGEEMSVQIAEFAERKTFRENTTQSIVSSLIGKTNEQHAEIINNLHSVWEQINLAVTMLRKAETAAYAINPSLFTQIADATLALRDAETIASESAIAAGIKFKNYK